MHDPNEVIQLDLVIGEPAYRAIAFDAAGGVAATETVEAGTDEEAIALVRQLGHRNGIDLWDRGRLIASFPPYADAIDPRISA